jgi:integrase
MKRRKRRRRGLRKMGFIYQRPDSAAWWICYSHAGRRYWESSHSTKKSAATALLKQRLAELGKGRPVAEAAKVTLGQLRTLHANDYARRGLRSAARVQQAWSRVIEHFGSEDEKAITVTAAGLEDYVDARTAQKAKPGTIHNELAALRRGFNLAQRKGILLASEVPTAWPQLAESKKREGFFERGEQERVRAALPPDVGDLVEFLFWCGWRVSEAQGLRWGNVDLAAKVIRIEKSKAKEPRTLPYGDLPELVSLIEHRRQVTDEVQKKRRMVIDYIFHRDGKPIRYFRRSWITACIKAGLGREVREPDKLDAQGNVIKRGRLIEKKAFRIVHDFRRTAARNLSRAGVPEQVIMRICGWKTRSVFDRYRIVPESDLREGLGKLAETLPAGEKVIPIG